MSSEDSEDQEDSEENSLASVDPVIAGPGKYYRIKQYILFLALFGYGGLAFLYDGFYRYPHQNQLAIEEQTQKAIAKGLRPEKVVDPTKVPHPGLDVPLNRVIGCLMPPLAILLLIRALHDSRGEYRLEGQTLHAPGHPPVPFANIIEIDRRQWDRKGIAYLSYALGERGQGTIRIDDEFYDRPPTDEIFRRVENYVNPPGKEDSEDSGDGEDKKEAHGDESVGS